MACTFSTRHETQNSFRQSTCRSAHRWRDDSGWASGFYRPDLGRLSWRTFLQLERLADLAVRWLSEPDSLALPAPSKRTPSPWESTPQNGGARVRLWWLTTA